MLGQPEVAVTTRLNQLSHTLFRLQFLGEKMVWCLPYMGQTKSNWIGGEVITHVLEYVQTIYPRKKTPPG
jgi:hypothetical protein